MDYNSLLAQYPGYAGWGTDEALADFSATGGEGKGGGITSQGGEYTDRYIGEVDMSQVPSVSGFIQGQFASENPYLEALIGRMGEREDPMAMYSRLEEEAGIPTLRKASTSLSQEVNTLEDTLRQIEPDVSAKTGQSLVTEAQRRGIVEMERKPVREKMADFSRDLGRLKEMLSNAMAGVATKTELGLRGQEQALEPLKLQYTTMVDRNARMLTGFTEDRQTQLDQLYDKLNRMRDLSDQEWDLANQLGAEERSYMKALQEAAATSGYHVTGNESIDDLLGIIGDKAAEQIAWERAQAGKGTAAERTKAEATTLLSQSVQQWARHDDLIAEYVDKGPLDLYEVTEAYNAGPMARLYGPADVLKDVSSAYQAGTGEYGETTGGTIKFDADGNIIYPT